MITIAALIVGLAMGGSIVFAVERYRRTLALQRVSPVRRIAFPFTGENLSEPALVAALRIARAEGATLMPIYLALVPHRLAVDVPLPREGELALTLLEAIDQRAARAEVQVDARIERGRTVRHALRELMAHQSFERMVVAAEANSQVGGFTPDDVAWLMANVQAEVIALRPAVDGQPQTLSAGI
ncbi:MAG: hypothetical protein ACRDK2_03140 [Solirubrobacteraceae bacterium]